MTAIKTQLGVVAESTYGTPLTVTRFYEYTEEGLAPQQGRSVSKGLRRNTVVERADRFHPYVQGAAGTIKLDVPTKGFGLLLSHALGTVSTGSITDSNYTQTHTLDTNRLVGKSLTAQINRPFNATGADQAHTFHGCKVLTLALSVDKEGLLVAELGLDAEDMDTSTGLATASYPADFHTFSWVGASFLIDGAATAANFETFKVMVDNKLNTGKRSMRSSALKKEPTPADRAALTWEGKIDWDDLTHQNKYRAATAAGAIGTILATFNGPVAHGGSTLPQLTISLPAARWDKAGAMVKGAEGLTQQVGGPGLQPTSGAEPITITYRTIDATP